MDLKLAQILTEYFDPSKATVADLKVVTGIRLALRDYYTDIQVLEFRLKEALKLGITLEMYLKLLKEREAASIAAFGTNE